MSLVFSTQSLMDSDLHHKATTHNSPKLAVFPQKSCAQTWPVAAEELNSFCFTPVAPCLVCCALIEVEVSDRAELE